MSATTNTTKKAQGDAETVKVNVKKCGRLLIEAGWTLVPNTFIERQKKLGLDP